MPKCRLLFVIYSLTSGGGEKALVNLLRSLSPERYDIELQMFENKGLNMEYLPQYVKVLPALFPNGMPSGKEQLERSLRTKKLLQAAKKAIYSVKAKERSDREKTYYAWKALRPLCRENRTKYNAVIAGMHGLVTYYAFDCISAGRKICWVHTDYSKISYLKQDFDYFKRAYRVVSVSHVCCESLRKAFPALNNILKLENINCPDLIRELANKELPAEYLNSARYRFVSIGRLIHLKGFDMAIDAAAQLTKKGMDFRWFILGEGVEHKKLQSQIDELGLSNTVFLLGTKANPYVYINGADIVVQTSRYEGKSMVLDEAKILGKPIVATSYNTVYDQITDGVNGMVVPISAKGIAEGLYSLLSDDELRTKIINNICSEDYSQNQLIERHQLLLEGCL